ncbi:DUF6474 family protein [Nakamurella lactea]|uniref:DUF6474 family protein n=1 Tax=Nakamurella lactea TaxID=459515 RepID=UPI00041F69BC|nr:DUF6474 family protein [Nakamurella lactea]
MFGKKKLSAAESMDAITEALADAESARRSAQDAAARALKAADNAELKAVKATAKEQSKVDKKAEKAAKAARKADLKSAKALAKQAKKGDKAAAEAAKKATEAAKKTPQSLFDKATDPKAARRVVTAAKVIGPVLAPFALKAATSTRDYLDSRKATQLGVSPAEVGAYRGATGKVEARLVGLKRSIADLRSRRSGDLQVTRFADVATGRITDLTSAVRAAASMPSGRRRATISAVNRELDQIDADLMTFLVGR